MCLFDLGTDRTYTLLREHLISRLPTDLPRSMIVLRLQHIFWTSIAQQVFKFKLKLAVESIGLLDVVLWEHFPGPGHYGRGLGSLRSNPLSEVPGTLMQCIVIPNGRRQIARDTTTLGRVTKS